MQALVKRNNPRVHQVVEDDATFEVHPDYEWVPVPPSCTTAWTYNQRSRSVSPPPKPDPADVAAGQKAAMKRLALEVAAEKIAEDVLADIDSGAMDATGTREQRLARLRASGKFKVATQRLK